jgi:hypothetical protein
MKKTNAFFNKITKSSANIIGKEIVAPYSYGINGGVCCAAETATLPSSATPSLITFHLPILNMYGTMEISDKLLRISEGGVGSSVDMLNFQMENLLASAKFNLRRMLFQNGSGVLTTFVSPSEPGNDNKRQGHSEYRRRNDSRFRRKRSGRRIGQKSALRRQNEQTA